MLIPLGTDRGLRRSAIVTPALVVLTVVAYLAMAFLERTDVELHERLWTTFWVVGGDGFRWWQPFTSTLLHAGLLHLGGNMLFLWVFGPPVEDRLGRVGFGVLYVAGAYAAGLLHAGFEREWVEMIQAWRYTAAVGASGAIAAVTGAFLVYFPRTVIRCFWILGFGVIGVPAWWFIGFAIAWNLMATGIGADTGVAYLAHLGGYALGFGVAFVLLAFRFSPSEPYDLFSMFRQAHRRRQFRAAAEVAERSRKKVQARPAMMGSATARARDEIAARRAEISRLLAKDKGAEACAAYRSLVADHADDGGAGTLARKAQYDIAARFVQAGEDADAAGAYERFLAAYPDDREAGMIGVLLARLWARTGRAGEAESSLRALAGQDEDADLRGLAQQELDALMGAQKESNA
ncbi:MAG: hypothetical protein DHS20C14_00910 [Phycisphaeraceae bacterium]|nr:MAG: hypothetical protein DHS20C14_00910 [Phycisphaeraceae bacterium]